MRLNISSSFATLLKPAGTEALSRVKLLHVRKPVRVVKQVERKQRRRRRRRNARSWGAYYAICLTNCFEKISGTDDYRAFVRCSACSNAAAGRTFITIISNECLRDEAG